MDDVAAATGDIGAAVEFTVEFTAASTTAAPAEIRSAVQFSVFHQLSAYKNVKCCYNM